MTTIDEMDEFVDWANAMPNPNLQHLQVQPQQQQPPTVLSSSALDPNLEMDLVLENVNEDDFSFFALQHFSGEVDGGAGGVLDDLDLLSANTTPFDASFVPVSELRWETPEVPCAHCVEGNFQCKRIQEGKYKGVCTSCVALRSQCSFNPTAIDPDSGASLPVNPWPTLGSHPHPIPNDDLAAFIGGSSFHGSFTGSLQSDSAADLTSLMRGMATAGSATSEQISPTKASPMPKIGARFSRESVRILKNWLSSHSRHPYPSDEEKEMLQRQTGLNKTQITNWLANARRRGKIVAPRSTSPHVSSWAAAPIDIPQRRSGTPAPLERMQGNSNRMLTPLERWADSPPENEPASVTAIARAITASNSGVSSGLNSPFSYNYTDDGSGRSLCNASSTSSVGTSHSSGGSFASAYSHGSRGSFGSFGSSFNTRGRRRRRRRAAASKPGQGVGDGTTEKTSLATPLKTFQCTFCTETFRTKHDWQRHEKSLHLSLERWVCSPDGPRAVNPTTGQLTCVFCGEVNPSDAHVETHNFSTCQEKSLEERTFYRKDHLNQHLKLVHNVKFLDWAMKPWKVATPEIRSRCGFCGIVMDTWTIRVDHLAEHFKTGNTMADWKGDWGFEAPVLDMVENSIPPYLIHDERNSPLPYVASHSPPESPRNAYELIKMELVFFATTLKETTGSWPTDAELQREACRIIFASEVLSLREISSTVSWLRDLIMSSDEITRQAKFGPLRSAAENRLSILKINGKDNLFEACPLEQQLHEFVRARRLLGLTAMDRELQEEACNIVGRMEEVSTNPSDGVANWLVRFINKTPGWLANFRARAHLPRSEDLGDERLRSNDPTTIDSTIYNYSRLERELGDYVTVQRSLGAEPTDADLQRQARIIIYEFDDGWNQTAADNDEWLTNFKSRHGFSGESTSGSSPRGSTSNPLTLTTSGTSSAGSGQAAVAASGAPTSGTSVEAATDCPVNLGCEFSFGEANELEQPNPGFPANTISLFKASPFFLNDANCYRRLAKQLSRYVAQCMSPHNPNQHVPTDEELQHQARWILYDDDDPWNQTAADNAEWLLRFKRDVGIITEDGPGLVTCEQWSAQQGGTGFAPPYAYPKAVTTAPPTDTVQVSLRDGAKPIGARGTTVNKFLETFTSRYPPPATVFCSRELEKGLADYVREQASATGVFPDDAALQARARDILGMERTSAEDPVLLEKFKKWMSEKIALPSMTGQLGIGALEAGASLGLGDTVDVAGGAPLDLTLDTTGLESVLPMEIDMNISDEDVNNILRDMNLEMGGGLGTVSGPAAGTAGIAG